MKKIRRIVGIWLVIFVAGLCAPSVQALDDPVVDSYACVLMAIDDDAETVLYSKNAQDLVYPASLTKIMTVLLAVEAVEAGTVGLSDPVTAQLGFDFDMIADGSSANLALGEIMTLEDLLYCAMVASANDACNVIAQYIGGSVENFVAMMNQRAAELGCVNTHFANTHGLPDSNHYTTAWDFALISREAVSHDLFMQVSNTVDYVVPATNVSGERTLSNSNSLINGNNPIYPGNYLYEYAEGVKTGHTNDAGYCLVSTARKDDVRLLSVVMNAQAYQIDDTSWYYGHFADTITLFDWAFDNFSYQEVVKSTEIVADVPVSMGADTDTVAARPSTSITALLPNDVDLSTFVRTITIYSQQAGGEPLEAPVSAGQPLGEISVSRDGVTLGTSTLVASSAVELSRVQYMKTQLRETLSKPAVILTFWALVLLFGLYIALVVRYRARRRAYQKRLENARRIRLDLEDLDEDEERYERNARTPARREETRPPARRAYAVHGPAEPLEGPGEDEEDEEPPAPGRRAARNGKPARPAAARKEVPPVDDEPTRVEPPLTRQNPLPQEDEEEFRDYFEEFFGKK